MKKATKFAKAKSKLETKARTLEEQELEALSKCSTAARRVYYDMRLHRRYVKAYDKKTPNAVHELARAGLLGITGRATIVQACYVPMFGYTPPVYEKFDKPSRRVEKLLTKKSTVKPMRRADVEAYLKSVEELLFAKREKAKSRKRKPSGSQRS